MTENVQPQIVNKQDFKVVGLRFRGNHDGGEIKALWDQFRERMEELQAADAGDAYGVMDNFDYEKGEYDYLAGLQVDTDEQAPEGMETWHVPAQNYAVFPTSVSSLMDAYEASESWFPTSNYRRAPGPEFERYGKDDNPADPDSPLRLYIPVEPLAGGE